MSNSPAAGSRIAFIDNLKVVLIIMVIAHHAGQAYGPTGGRWPFMYPEKAAILGTFFYVNASFFMGLFFLISAYFLPRSYDRKGAARFMKERLVRFGSVILAFQFLVYPGFAWLLEGRRTSFPTFWFEMIVTKHEIEFAHLWFLSHLLAYAVLYVAWRALRGPLAHNSQPRPFPSHMAIAAYALCLGLVSGIVRHWFPIDRWVFIGVPAEVAHLPQYASLFVLGLLAYRNRWLPDVPVRAGRVWLTVGLLLAAFRYAYSLLGWRFLRRTPGAFDWPGLFWVMWEAFFCIGMCIGSLYAFRTWWNRRSRFGGWLSDNAYAVYVVHLPVVVVAQVWVSRTGWGPLTLTALSTLVGVILSYLVAAGLRALPGVRRVL